MRLPALITLLIMTALVVAACGGPSNPDEALAKACKRQQTEIADSASESDTPTAKSTEDAVASETLVQCAGQAPATQKAGSEPTKEQPGMPAEKTPTTKAESEPVELDPAARELFSSKCGGCHALSDAKTSGAVGPNLDETKMTASEIEQQIINGKNAMPAGMATGADATSIAEYVAGAAAQQ